MPGHALRNFELAAVGEVIGDAGGAEGVSPSWDQYTVQGDEFSRAIQAGGDVPVTLEDALGNMAVIEGVFRSAETGCWAGLG